MTNTIKIELTREQAEWLLDDLAETICDMRQKADCIESVARQIKVKLDESDTDSIFDKMTEQQLEQCRKPDAAPGGKQPSSAPWGSFADWKIQRKDK